MAFAINLLISGLATGLLYALTGLGLVVVYRTTRILNFAGGDIATVLAYFTYVLLMVLHFPYFVAAPATLVAGAALGYLFSRGIIDPLGRRAGRWLRIRGMYEEHTVLNIVIGTFAFAMLAEGLEQIIAGSEIGTLRRACDRLRQRGDHRRQPAALRRPVVVLRTHVAGRLDASRLR